MGPRIYPSYQDTNLTANGSLILSIDSTIDYIDVYVNNVLSNKQYSTVNGLYTYKININDVVNITSPSTFSIGVIRRDYTNDDINNDNGIKDTTITGITSISSYTFTATTLSSSYNFEYRTDIKLSGPTPTPTPTPSATPTATPTPTPTLTPTSTPTATPVPPTPTPTGGTATINYYFSWTGGSNRIRNYSGLQGNINSCFATVPNFTSSAGSGSYSATTFGNCTAINGIIGGSFLVQKSFSESRNCRCTVSSCIMNLNNVNIYNEQGAPFDVPPSTFGWGGANFNINPYTISNGDVLDIYVSANIINS